MSDTDLSRTRFPWLRSGFDLEGYVGALTAWLAGILLGFIWGPLFWIGFAAAIIILFATRTAERTPPIGEDLIVAPCDGVLVSVDRVTPPAELRLEGDQWSRLRISVGPMKTNGLYAAMDGAVDHVIRETGDPSAFAALDAERLGLAVAYVALESGDRAMGFRFATGGFGPRLEIDFEAGDAVRLGRKIGTMRLGGWCDLYVPGDITILPAPGQTLVSSETLIGHFGDDQPSSNIADIEDVLNEPSPADPIDELSEADITDVFEEEDEALTLEKIAGAESSAEVATKPDDEEDVSEMFARLKKEASKAYKDE